MTDRGSLLAELGNIGIRPRVVKLVCGLRVRLFAVDLSLNLIELLEHFLLISSY